MLDRPGLYRVENGVITGVDIANFTLVEDFNGITALAIREGYDRKVRYTCKYYTRLSFKTYLCRL